MAALDLPNDSTGGYRLPDSIPADEVLTERQRALRDLFVSEYLVDFDQVKAAMRCGFNFQFAQEYSAQFMQEPYVQRKLNEIKFMQMDPKKEEEYDKARIKQQLMREAHYHGPGSTHAGRVAALGRLAAMYGMEAPKKIDANVNHRGGVMAVPGIAALDAWEQTASASQDALVQHANDV